MFLSIVRIIRLRLNRRKETLVLTGKKKCGSRFSQSKKLSPAKSFAICMSRKESFYARWMHRNLPTKHPEHLAGYYFSYWPKLTASGRLLPLHGQIVNSTGWN